MITFLFLYLSFNYPDLVDNVQYGVIQRRQAQTCVENVDFSCVSGGCVSRYDVCDAVSNCADGSDETAVACREVGLYDDKCPQNNFKCEYGACVHLERQCDGTRDCRDNSDERGCPGQSAAPSLDPRPSVCNSVGGVMYSQCDNGQCIDQYNVCDGNVDCADSSDETEAACFRLFNGKCDPGQFRCAYGACLQQSKHCDGHQDCWDGSDEVCGSYTRPPAVTPARPVPSKQCVIPASAENRRFVGLNCRGSGCALSPGQSVGDQQFVVASCDSGHQLGQNKSKVILSCSGGQWFPEMPYCQRDLNEEKNQLQIQLFKIALYEKRLQARILEIALGLPQSKYTYGINSNTVKVSKNKKSLSL